MRRPLLAALTLLLAASAAAASASAAPVTPAGAAAARWRALLREGDASRARLACAGFAIAADPAVAAEGERCLAQLELAGALTDDSAARALPHLDRALELVPSDLPTHEARLRALVATGHVEQVAPALSKALADAPPASLDAAARERLVALAASLFERAEPAACLAALRLLDARWPDDARIVGNMGSALAVLERDGEALAALTRATRLAPDEPAHRWNLARLLESMGRDDEAAEQFARWSSVERDPAQRAVRSCTYARFVQERRHDLARACRIQQESCPPGERTACDALAQPVGRKEEP